MDPLTLLAGGALLAIGQLAGFIIGRRKRHTQNVDQPICSGCNHGLAYHDPETKECHQSVYIRAAGAHSSHHAQCTCRQYVGPLPAELMLASFTLPPTEREER